jgi:hypothetical protein
MAVPAIVGRSPPLRGHLRLAGFVGMARYLMDLAYKLPNGINFRSVELEGFGGDYAQHILNGCAHTLEHLTMSLSGWDGTRRLSSFSLAVAEWLANLLP